ncbi:hypothetical protein F0249_15165 [Vibrio sp. 03-59-1]|uniref:GPO family capsid scaffolding protein n=1 Tax=Vibrio sp. 03-59-1 TaxID=2607607 RepID=UPI0014937711|nr:hypothetical protein [Vibrio sp. 03-59-1]
MFISDPICILTAGIAVNGKEISQTIIDEMAEGYNPSVYTARIKKDLAQFGDALGSVASLEKQGNKLYAVLKPNSKLLRTVEQGQLLHTTCEYVEEFAGTGKAYLTGLALTDNPSSLGTTQIHLSATSHNDIIKKNSFYEKGDQISELKNKITTLSAQLDSLTIQANALTNESDREGEEDMYL